MSEGLKHSIKTQDGQLFGEWVCGGWNCAFMPLLGYIQLSQKLLISLPTSYRADPVKYLYKFMSSVAREMASKCRPITSGKIVPTTDLLGVAFICARSCGIRYRNAYPLPHF